jgi:hypothetical protein
VIDRDSRTATWWRAVEPRPRRGGAPALWRAAFLGWLAAATAGSLFFPVVLVAALAVVTVEPLLSARRQPRSRARRSRLA